MQSSEMKRGKRGKRPRPSAAATATATAATVQPSPGGGWSVNVKDLVSVSIDPGVLDCPICYENLLPPIFQCNNGHTVCSSCCNTLKNCPSCTCLIGGRCHALENVIEAIKVPCPYSSYGCEEIVSYTHRHVHKEACTYSPCHCPIAGCTHTAPGNLLYHHFDIQHHDHATSFLYDTPFEVYLHEDDTSHILRGHDSILFLLLKNGEVPMGNSIMLTCLGSDTMKDKFSYQLLVKSSETCIQFQSSMTYVKRLDGAFPPKDFLIVPQRFYGASRKLILEISVQKKVQEATPWSSDRDLGVSSCLVDV